MHGVVRVFGSEILMLTLRIVKPLASASCAAHSGRSAPFRLGQEKEHHYAEQEESAEET